MNAVTLEALRRLLFFSRPEAALLVASSPDRPRGVSDRSWRMWEDGELSIPEEVARNIRRLVEWRQSAIDATVKQISSMPGEASLALVWYSSLDEWASLPGREPVSWRPHQSVCAALTTEFPGRVLLIAFDGPQYSAWLGAKPDSETA